MPAERSPSRTSAASRDKDGDKKCNHRFQDALPLEKSTALDARSVTVDTSHRTDRTNESAEKIKHSNPTSVTRFQSFFQRNDRGTAARDGRHSGPGRTSERRRWNDSREDRTTGIVPYSDPKEKNEKPKARRGDGHAWQHDKFSEADANPPAKKRRHFREEKLRPESELAGDAAPMPIKDAQSLNSTLESGRREETHREHRPSERGEYRQPYGRERSFWSRGRIEKTGLPHRDRFNGSEHDPKYRGRDKFDGLQGHRSSGGRVEKWKHDMFVEANRSPKIEEDPTAKVEALLSL